MCINANQNRFNSTSRTPFTVRVVPEKINDPPHGTQDAESAGSSSVDPSDGMERKGTGILSQDSDPWISFRGSVQGRQAIARVYLLDSIQDSPIEIAN